MFFFDSLGCLKDWPSLWLRWTVECRYRCVDRFVWCFKVLMLSEFERKNARLCESHNSIPDTSSSTFKMSSSCWMQCVDSFLSSFCVTGISVTITSTESLFKHFLIFLKINRPKWIIRMKNMRTAAMENPTVYCLEWFGCSSVADIIDHSTPDLHATITDWKLVNFWRKTEQVRGKQ